MLMRCGAAPDETWWDEALALACNGWGRKELVLLWMLVESVNEVARSLEAWPTICKNADDRFEAVARRLEAVVSPLP